MKRKKSEKPAIIPCKASDEARARIESYAGALLKAAPGIGNHGLSQEEFWRSGLLRGAIEKLRGSNAATIKEKKKFIEWALGRLKASARIKDFEFTGAKERHDYQVMLLDDRQSIFEAKGCLDGNNTNIFQRPPNADEFLLWSLCQNPGADPRHNIWSGVHTRLGGRIIAEKERIDALIVWDMLCGGLGRPCPKVEEGKGVQIGDRIIPPPCIYLFPRSIPDPRNNPAPPAWKLSEVGLAKALLEEFGGDNRDVTEVLIEVRMNGPHVERRTRLVRDGEAIIESKWTELKRASR